MNKAAACLTTVVQYILCRCDLISRAMDDPNLSDPSNLGASAVERDDLE